MITKLNNRRDLAIVLLLTACVFFVSCKQDRLKVDVSGIEANIKFYRFDKDIMEMDTNNIRQAFYSLEKKYLVFLPNYYSNVVGLGRFSDSNAPEIMRQFINFPPTQELYKKVKNKFPSTEKYNQEITDVFKHYKYYFSTDTLPDIIYFMGIL